MRARTRSRENAVFSVDASRRKMSKREGPSTSGPRTRSKASRGGRDEREIGNTQHLLDKLPQEVWEKILDELKNADLFPLALSCRYFRQKQKELVERKRREQSGDGGGAPCLALKTTLRRKLDEGQPASAEYLQFCSKERCFENEEDDEDDNEGSKAYYVMALATYHGHLPLLQELHESFKKTACGLNFESELCDDAGESSSSQSLLLFLFRLLTSFMLFSSSQCAEASWRLCSGLIL